MFFRFLLIALFDLSMKLGGWYSHKSAGMDHYESTVIDETDAVCALAHITTTAHGEIGRAGKPE